MFRRSEFVMKLINKSINQRPKTEKRAKGIIFRATLIILDKLLLENTII